MIIGHFECAMTEKRIVAVVGYNRQLAFDAPEPPVLDVTALGLVPMRPDHRRGVPHAPRFAAGPEGGDAPLHAGWLGEKDVEGDLVERIVVGGFGFERKLHHPIRLRGCRKRDLAEQRAKRQPQKETREELHGTVGISWSSTYPTAP